nr:zinc finger, CCHC-type [Tanacetum cinerariifolium]
MVPAAMKHMALSFAKLKKFEGVDFRRRQKKMHFMLSSMSVVYVFTTPMPEDEGENLTVEQVRKRTKWDNDDYVCRGLILNGMSDSLFDIYQNVDTSKELWDTLKAKYIAEDASSKKLLVSNFTNYKMTDSKPVLEQYNELLGILGRFTQHKMNMDECIQVSCIIDKLPPSWKDFKHTLKHLKEELTLVEFGSHLRIEEYLRAQDNDKPKGNNVVGPLVVNMVEHNNSSMYNDHKGKRKHHDTRANPNKKPKDDDVAWWVDSGATVHVCKDRCWVPNKRNKITPYELWTKKKPNLNYLRVWGCRAAVRLPDPKLKTLGERGIECIFVGYAEHSKSFRFYVIKPNDSVAFNSIIESKDVMFDENRVTDEIVQQSEPELRKGKGERTQKDFELEFQLYLIEGTRDLISNQHSYCFNVEDDPKTFNEAMKSQDIFKRKKKVDGTVEKFKARLVIQGFNQNLGIDYFDTYASVARISTIRLLIAMASIHNLIIHLDVKTNFLNGDLEEEVYMNQPLGFIMPGNENKLTNVYSKFDASGKGVIICLYVEGTDQAQSHCIEKVLKKFNYSACTPVSTPLDTCEKLMPNRGLAVSQLEYSRVIGCLMHVMTCTRPDIAFVVGKLSRYTSNPETQHWLAIQRVMKYLKKTTDYRLVYSGYPSVLEGYTDQTCITGSIIEYEFVALAAAGKEAEWLKNLLLEIHLWVKPIAPIFIRCDSATTLKKAYSQMYNGMSRNLGVRHSMIRELVMNGWVEARVLQIILRMCLEPARVDRFSFVAHRVSKLKDTIRGYSIRGKAVGNIHQRVDGFSFVTHRVSKLKDTIRGYSIRGSILSGIYLQRLLITFTLLWAITTNNQSKLFVIINVAAMKHMASSFAKLKKFEGMDFRRWQKKMHFMLSSMSVVYVLTTHMPEDGVSCIIDKLPPSWKDFKHALKHLNEELTLVELGSHLRIEESLRAQDNDKPNGNNVAGPSVVNMMEHNNSSRYNDHKGKRKHHDTRANPNKKPKVTCLKCRKPGHLKRIARLVTLATEPMDQAQKDQRMDDDVAWWADSGAIVHVCKDRCWFKTYESLNDGSILHMGNESTALVHGRGYVDLRLNIVSDNIGSAFMSTSKLNDLILWHARLGHVQFKRMQDMSKDGLIPASDMDTERVLGCRAAVRLPDPKLKTLGERGIECIFVGYAEHSKDFRFYVIEPNDSVAINSIIKSRDAIFDENMFSYVPRPSQTSLVKGTEDSGGSVVSKRVTDKIVQQSEPELKKSKRQRTPKDFGPEFQLYLIEETRDLISNEHSYCFNIEDDPKTFNKAMKPLGCKWIFKRKMKVDGTVEKFKASTIRLLIVMASIHNLIIHQMDVKTAFLNGDLKEETPKQWHQMFDEVVLSNGYLLNQADKCVYSKFDASSKGVIICLYVDDKLIFGTDHAQSHYTEKVLKKFNYSDCTLVSTPLDTCEKLMHNRGLAVSQLEYSRVIGCLMYAMTCTRPDIAFAVGKLSWYTSYTDASWINNTEDNLSKSGWVFLLGDAAGKEVEWLKNLLFEIPRWVKPITPISICYDGAATLAKAYSQLYNGKSRHLGVKNNMIRELIMNGVRAEARVLPILPRMCLEPVVKRMKLLTSYWYLGMEVRNVHQRSMNTRTLIVVKGIHVSDEEVAGNIHQRVDGFSFVAHKIEPSAGMLHSGLADDSGL